MSILYVKSAAGTPWASRIDTDKVQEWIRACDAGVYTCKETHPRKGEYGQFYIDEGHWIVISEEEAFELYPDMRDFVARYLINPNPSDIPQTQPELVW